MQSGQFPPSLSDFANLALPTYLTFRAATEDKSVYLRAFCDTPDPVVEAIQRAIERRGGMSVSRAVASDGISRHISIGARMPGLCSADVGYIRTAIDRAGGIVETVRVNYRIRRSPYDPKRDRPQACLGCHHYYGQQHGGATLVCAMHPYGPSDPTCQDWERSESTL